MPTAAIDPVTLHYELGASEPGPRVVYVSGSGSDLRNHPNALDSPLATTCHLLAYDHRGLGRSSPGPEPPTMAGFATDLLALLDHVAWDQCRMVGVSFGGMVAQEAAVRAPDRFERVVLACTSSGGEGGSSYPLHELEGLEPDARNERRADIIDLRNADQPRRRQRYLELFRQMDEARAAGPDRTSGEAAQLDARRHHDVFDRLPAMTMPVLIAAGRYDGIAPPANQEALLAQLPNAELRWYEGGHGFFLEDPAAHDDMVAFLTAP